jgi:predicted nucleic acid-binding protein
MALNVPSDRLRDLRELFLGWGALYRELEMQPQIVLVFDTNAILGDIRFLAKSLRNQLARTRLQEVIDSGVVVALAPLELREEVIEKIPLLAAREGISEDLLRRAWIEYQPLIRFIEVGPFSAEERAAAVDPDDLPFVSLYRKVEADAVVSRDWHIRAMGARSIKPEALTHVRDYARAKAPEVTLRVGAMAVAVPPIAGAHALWKLSVLAVKKFSGLPSWVQLTLLAGALAVGTNPRSRQALSAAVSPLTTKLKGAAPALLELFGTLAEELHAAQRKADDRQRVFEEYFPRQAKRPLKMVARSVCLQADAPLSVDELVRGVLRSGYESSSSQLKYYLLRVLRQSEQFVCTRDGRWSVRGAAATY